jgi:hypothetical protein
MFAGMGDEEEQEEEEEPVITLQDMRRTKMKPVEEIRVYMVPPVERTDGDTDRDSGRIDCRYLFESIFSIAPILFKYIFETYLR